MANYQIATLTADIFLRDKAFQDALARIHGQLSDLDSQLNRTGIGFKLFGVGLDMVGNVFNAVVKEADNFTKVAMDIESRFAQISKTTGLAGGNLAEFKNKLGDLSTTMAGVKFTDLSDIAEMGGRMGVASNQLVTFARDIGMVRIAIHDIPADEAASKISRILNVFHLGTDSTINFASALTKLDQSSTATGREILDITRRLSGTASTLGLSPEKVLALSTVLLESGVSAEVAGTSMSMVLAKMATHTELFANVAGKSLGQFVRTIRADPLTALNQFLQGLNKLDAMDRFAVLDEMHLKGQRAAGTLLQLSQVMNKLPGYVGLAEREWKSLNSIQEQVGIQADTTAAQIVVMQNHILLLRDKVGNYFLPAIKATASAMGEVANDLMDMFNPNSEGLKNFIEQVTTGLRYTGLLVKDFKTFVELGRLFAVEKFEQFMTVLSRVGEDLGKNIITGVTDSFVIVKNLFQSLGTFLVELFYKVGVNISAQLINAFDKVFLGVISSPALKNLAQMLDNIPGLGRKATAGLNATIAAARAKPPVPVPPIAADASVFNRDALLDGVSPLPGFNNPFVNLPNRRDQMAPLVRGLDEHLAVQEMEMERRKNAAKPKGVDQDNRTALAKLNERRWIAELPDLDIPEREAQRRLRALERKDRMDEQAETRKGLRALPGQQRQIQRNQLPPGQAGPPRPLQLSETQEYQRELALAALERARNATLPPRERVPKAMQAAVKAAQKAEQKAIRDQQREQQRLMKRKKLPQQGFRSIPVTAEGNHPGQDQAALNVNQAALKVAQKQSAETQQIEAKVNFLMNEWQRLMRGSPTTQRTALNRGVS